MKIDINYLTLLHVNKNEILSLLLIIFLILLSIGSSGCLEQDKPGQRTMNLSNNSPIPSSNVPTPIPTILDPSVQSGVRIFKSAESICIGDVLTFGLINEGNSTIIFGMGNPFQIQVDNNGTWGKIYSGGGTQGFWKLTPGIEGKWKKEFATGNSMYEFYNDPFYDFIVRPGFYRIEFGGDNYETKEPFRLATEFTIRDCQSGTPG